MSKARFPRPESFHILEYIKFTVMGKILEKEEKNEQFMNVCVEVKVLALNYIPSLGTTTLMLIQSSVLVHHS